MEEENLTYRKCCTTPFTPDRQWVLAYCEPSASSLPPPPRDVLTLSVSIFTKPCLLSNFLAERTRALHCCALRVWYKSCLGHGALLGERRNGKFCMCLPAKSRRRVMPRKPVVLCVDDEWNGLEGRKMLLEEAACKVLVATSGAAALQLFASHPVDLVLLDYHMPGINGDVVAEHMKAVQPDVPIALLSADDGLPESALKWVDAFVSKSESPANLNTDCRAFARSAFSICPSRFNPRARKTRGVKT